ncbi:putative soluble pyridine nucleotide transhydrogenase [Phytophthora cinnamomi]|uniref:putative soluble pyridine nucleotide transhydrogenase n=1 Tax=Phytophthora cinnamomi TaxID=4785 RepID=UPI00355ACBE3|nr:putative soluble pyridine nucleotide transhydrogenase [Phytophthora cinnamomi]
MKSPAPGDVIYHRYPSTDFDPAEKPIPVAVAVDANDTDDDDEASVRQSYSPPAPLAPSPPSRCQSFCARLGRLFVFHTLNAFLGIGGAIIVLVLVPLSVGLVPLFGVGIMLFQVSAAVVEVLAKMDIRLANMVSKQEPKLRKAYGIQSGLSTNNGCSNCCQRLFFLSSKTLLVMLYFATLKLVIGTLSLIAVGWGLVLPVEALTSGGRADAIGWINYQDHPSAYVGVVLGCWALGLVCIAFVDKLSVALTTWACAERDDVEELRTPRADQEVEIDMEAVVIQTPTPEAKSALC